jgi:autoinducer 2-degrading protein
MITLIVDVQVKPEHTKDFIRETIKSQAGTIIEPGCTQYDFCQTSDECKFILVESYKNQEAIEEHKKTTHFLTWRENIEPFMAAPRKVQRCEKIINESH